MIAGVLSWRASWQMLAVSGLFALLVFKVSAGSNTNRAGLLLSVLVAVLLLPVLAKHPTATLCALLVFLPLQVPLLGFLYGNGLPHVIARRLGALKDLAGIALLLRAYLDRGTRASRPADRWLLAYVGVATAYLFLPYAFTALTQIPLSQRIVAWRVEVFYVLVLVALRWIDARHLNVSAIRWTVVVLGSVVAAGAIYEYVDATAWKSFIYDTLGVRRYSAEVLNIHLDDTSLIRYSKGGAVRSGSFLREPVFCAFFLLPAFFVSLTQISSRKSVVASLLTAVIGTGLVLTTTRSALVVGVIGAALASARLLRSGNRYTRLFVPVLAILLVVSPVLIAQSSVASRVSESLSGQDSSTQGHSNDLAAGLERAFKDPLGKGLGSGALGERLDVTGAITTENAYLQVVNEMGLLALVAFLAFLFALSRELASLAPGGTGLLLDSSAALAVALAMIVGGVLQTVWLDIAVGVNAMVVMSLPLLQDYRGLSTRSRTAPSNQAGVTSAVPADA